jgi:hypothetical protein
VLAVAERGDEAEGGVVAEAENAEADGLHEVLSRGKCVSAPRATMVSEPD